MRINFLGAEQRTFRDMLLDNGADAMGLSYSALVRRAGGKPKTPLAERFPDEHDLLLDSGGYQANSGTQQRTRAEWESYAQDYVEFALANAERCTLITEFDFLGLGPDWLEEMRRGVWKDVGERFLPVWHPEQGLAALEVTAERFGRVGVVSDILAAPGQTAASQLRQLARRGIEVHGLGMTKTEVAENIPFTSISSSSWISPMKYGDVIVFDGRTLHRYPVKYADRARKRHRMWVEQNEFDGDAWMRGDKNELIRVGIWSWLEWSDSLAARHGLPVNSAVNTVNEQPEGVPATISRLPVHRSAQPTARAELQDLPVFGFRRSEKEGEEGGHELLPVISEASMRSCDTCFLAANNCPGYEPGAACAFKFPVRVETKGQRKAVFNGAVELQFQRVALMYANEQLSGGYADPNLSQEIDRLVKMMATQAEIEDERDYFEMTVRAKGKTGVLSRLMGTDIGAAASRVPRPLDDIETDRVIAGQFERH